MEQISAKNSSSKVWVLVGITSYGDISCGGSGVYTNVSYYYDWIMENSKIWNIYLFIKYKTTLLKLNF